MEMDTTLCKTQLWHLENLHASVQQSKEVNIAFTSKITLLHPPQNNLKVSQARLKKNLSSLSFFQEQNFPSSETSELPS